MLGFRHRKVTQLWPRANGEVERFMKTLKKCIKAAKAEGRNWREKLHPNIKTNLIVKLENDNNIILRNNNAPISKVILTKFRLWCPKIIFNGTGTKQYLENYLKPKKWIYLKEYSEIMQTGSTNSYFRRPRHVFIWTVGETKYNSQTNNIFTFDSFIDKVGGNQGFTRAQLEINNSNIIHN